MLTYPVYFPLPRYSGRDQRKLEKIYEQIHVIKVVSKYVNEIGIKNPKPIHCYTYTEIANTLRLDVEYVKNHCMVDGGHNGFMVLRPGLTLEEATEEATFAAVRECSR